VRGHVDRQLALELLLAVDVGEEAAHAKLAVVTGPDFADIANWDFLQEFRRRALASAQATTPNKPFLVVAEDSRRDFSSTARDARNGAPVVDAIWSFGYRDEIRRLATNDITTRFGQPSRTERVRHMISKDGVWNAFGDGRFDSGYAGNLLRFLSLSGGHRRYLSAPPQARQEEWELPFEVRLGIGQLAQRAVDVVIALGIPHDAEPRAERAVLHNRHAGAVGSVVLVPPHAEVGGEVIADVPVVVEEHAVGAEVGPLGLGDRATLLRLGYVPDPTPTQQRFPYTAPALKHTDVAEGSGARATVVRLDLDRGGVVRNVAVLVPSADAAFDQELLARVARDAYAPARLGGRSIGASVFREVRH